MSNGSVDPASLEGDDLDQWYCRSPWQVAQDRQTAQQQQYDDFFGLQGASSDDSSDASDSSLDQPSDDEDQPSEPTSAVSPPPSSAQSYFPVVRGDVYTPGLLGDLRSLVPTDEADSRIVTNGDDYTAPNTRPFAGQAGGSVSNSTQAADTSTLNAHNALYDNGLAGSEDGGEFSLVGNPANPRLRKEWSQKWGLAWPKDPATGRNYDVAHIIAKADGGKDHVDNIRPMHPDDHIAEHVRNGDLARWARRAGIARAFGGTVARAIEPLSILSGILGILTGNTRIDTLDNFAHDMMGTPSDEDLEKAFEARQKAINPKWKPGDPYVI